jgi:hypothetical protein
MPKGAHWLAVAASLFSFSGGALGAGECPVPPTVDFDATAVPFG